MPGQPSTLDLNSQSQELSDWLGRHPGLTLLLNSPLFKISQSLLPQAIRVTAHESRLGRYLCVLDLSGQLTYVFNFSKGQVAFDVIEKLVNDIEQVDGLCHATPQCLVFRLPLSHQLIWGGRDGLLFEVRSFFTEETVEA